MDKPEEEAVEQEVVEEVMDLPERIDLSFFLEKMLPTECQQTIRWTTELKSKKKDPIIREDVRLRKRNQEYYDILMRQLVDPEFPTHKKMLNALYAEWFMEHGDFDVPDELKHPGYGLPEDGTWFAEEGKESDESLTGEPEAEEEEEEEEEVKGYFVSL